MVGLLAAPRNHAEWSMKEALRNMSGNRDTRREREEKETEAMVG
jgi:hypothetical protein